MDFVAVVVALIVLAVATQLGVLALERIYPPHGQFVEVEGARLHLLDLGPRNSAGLPIVFIHGASSSLRTMQEPLGAALARRHRVILIDRPGQGWSTRVDEEHFTLETQGRMIDQVLEKIGVSRAIFVGHSWGGALVAAFALNHPQRVAGLVMLAPVLYPWPGGVGVLNWLATLPLIGPMIAYTLPIPLGYFLAAPSTRSVFAPQLMPGGYLRETAVRMVLRPRAFLSNARDLVMLKPQVARQARDYHRLQLPMTIIAGDADLTVSTEIHSQAFATAIPHAKLIILPGVGHMPHMVAPDLIVHETEIMASSVAPRDADRRTG